MWGTKVVHVFYSKNKILSIKTIIIFEWLIDFWFYYKKFELRYYGSIQKKVGFIPFIKANFSSKLEVQVIFKYIVKTCYLLHPQFFRESCMLLFF